MDWDVIVVGMGTAGAAAALESARLGLRTLGVERTGAMGGQPTSGCICFGTRLPGVTMLAFERDAERLGLSRAYETVPMAVKVAGGRIVSATFVSDGVVREESARVFIDATGNGTLARLAGLPLRKGRPRDGAMACSARAELWKMNSGGIRPYYRNFNVNLSGSAAEYAKAVSFLADTRVEEYGRWLKAKGRMLAPATLVGAREERRTVTEQIVTFRDLLLQKPWPDTIFYGFGPEDYVSPDGRLAYESDEILDWKVICYLPAFGYPYAIPYGTIVAKGVSNLFVPSKHMGVSHDCGGAVRMQGEMRKSGVAAACAASVMLKEGCAARDVKYAALKPLLRNARNLARLNKNGVDTINGFSFGRPFTADEIVSALSKPVVRAGEWWNSQAKNGRGERASYAYWNCWNAGLSGTEGERQSLGDRLSSEMASARGQVAEGNLAVAMALMGDRRCLPVLRTLVRNPSPASDPVGPRIYPNRLKAIPFLGRFGDRESVNALRAIRDDGARSFTANIDMREIFPSRDTCREEALSLVEVALERLG